MSPKDRGHRDGELKMQDRFGKMLMALGLTRDRDKQSDSQVGPLTSVEDGRMPFQLRENRCGAGILVGRRARI